MRKKFLLVLTVLVIALGGSGKLFAQQLLVNCDYNSSTEGYGVTKFSNYAGAYAYATANDKTATIVIEKTNTLSGNTFDNNHKNYSKLAVVIKDGATMGNAASKWDMTYPVTVEPGGTLTCARPKSASVSNIHIKNKLIVGAKGATKKAYVNFLSDSYQDCDISIRYNGSIEVYNADFYIQDLDAQGKLTIEDSEVYVDGAFASATSSFYPTTLTNSTITINGNQISGGLSDFAGGTSNQLGNVKINNSTLTIKEGDTKVAANVTATNSTIAVNNLTVNSGKTLNLNEGSTLDANGITNNGTVKVDGEIAKVEGNQILLPVAKIGETKYETLSAAFAAVTEDDQTVVVLRDVTENLTSTLRGNITTENGAKVTITLTNSDWLYCPYTFVVGENVTLNVPYLFYYAGGAQINGKVVADAYYQRYAGTKLTINEPGNMTVTTEMFYLRYTDADANAGIYINGDNNTSTIGLKLSVAYFYQGMINAKDANIETSVYWQTNETDQQGSANLVLDNSTLKVTGNELNFKATGNSTVTLTNNSKIVAAGGFEYGNNTEFSVDATSSITDKNGVVALPVAKIGETKYKSLEAAFTAATEGQTITLLADATPALTSQRAITKAAVIDLGGKTLTLTEDDLYFGTTTFKNGTIVVDPSVKPSTAVFWMFANQTLTFDAVKVVATGVTGTYLIGLDGNNSDLNLINGSEILVENTTALDLDIICVNASTGNDIKVENSKVNVTNLDGRVFFRGNYTVKDSEVNLAGITKAGFRIEAGQTLSIEGTSKVNIEGEPRDGGIHLTDLTATYTKASTATVIATVNEVKAIAIINGKKYASLQAAVSAVQDGQTITLVSDVTENVTLTEKVGLRYTIDGADNTMNGKFTITPLSDENDNRRITIKNINFVNTADAAVDFISCAVTNHYPRLTVEGCDFTGNGKKTDVALRLKTAYGAVIKNCTGTGLHSFLQNTAGKDFTIENVIVTNSKSGLALGTVQGVTVKGCEIAVAGYGIRMDANTYNNNAVIESNTIEAFIPVVVRNVNTDSNITFKGTNTFTASNTDGLWCAIGATEYEENGKMPTAPATGRVKVTLNGTGLAAAGIYGNFVPVAKIGAEEYASLENAIAAATDGAEVVILEAGTYTVPSGKNLTITGTVDGVVFANIGAHNMGGANVTFNNVTFTYADNSTYKGLQHSGNLVYNNCTFNGQVFLYGESETFNGCTFNTTDKDNYNVWTYSAENVAFNECVFNCAGKSVLIYHENASVINNVAVERCQFKASQAVEGKAAIEMDSSLTSGINLTIDGETTVTGFGAGNVSGNSLWNNKKGDNDVANSDIKVVVNGNEVLSPKEGGTWGGIDWLLSKDGTLTIAPTKGTPVADKNSGKTYDVGAWREAVRYNSKGEGVAIEGWPYDRSKVKTLVIKEGVISIGSFTAQGYTNLTGEVVIPSTVKYIGQEAFQKSTMTKLTFASVPAGETGEELCIAQGAFKNLIIEEVSLPADRPVHLHAWVFNNCNNLKTAHIPASVVSVHGTNHIDYFKDFNAHSNPTWTKSSEIFAYNKNMETVTFGSEEVRDLFYSYDNNTSDKDYIVATVGLTSYCKIADAIAAVNENGGTIKLHGNATLADTWTIPAGKEVTLNLNGKTISQSKACTASYEMINNKGNLNIVGSGKISFTDTSAGDPNFGWGSYTVRNEGNLVVENATIEHKGAQAFGTHCIMAIFQYSGSTTINGGTISTPNYRSARLWKGDMTINGGTFNGQVWVQAVDNSAKLTIKGGTFSPKGNDASSVFVSNDTYNVALAVADGTFNGKVGCSDAAKLAGTITGGKFTEKAKNGTNSALIATGLTFGEADANGYYAVEDDPTTHYINNVEELVAFRDAVNNGVDYFEGVTVYLAADLDLTGINWVGIGSMNKDHGFMGNFDGQNHTIKNLTITNPTLDSDNYAYAGLFGLTEGVDKDHQNFVKDLTIENVKIETEGHIAAAAIAYAYYTIVDNVKVCGNIAIKGGDYTAGVLAYTRRCVNASNLSIVGNEGSFVEGNRVVGGVISDIQMNGGLIADYDNFSAQGIAVKGTQHVGGISGIIATQTLIGATVKNVTLSGNAGVGIVSGALGGTSTISDVVFENVTGATDLLGATYNGGAIEAKIGDTYYATLANALAANGEVTVELLAPVTIPAGEPVVFNLNKKTVVATDNATGSYAMITNKGDLTIEGEGKLQLTATIDRDWNAYSSVISNTVGGKLTVNGGTIEHLGGTDMAYGIDNLTNGKGTYAETVVNGGTVKSTYRAIRQFLNGVEAQNILTVNGGTIASTNGNKSIWMQDPSANANSGTLTVGAEAKLYGDVYLFVTAGSTEWPVEVSIANAAFQEGTVVTGNVPEEYIVKNNNGVWGVFDAVAQVNGTNYAFLQEAINNSTENATITLLSNVEQEDGVIITDKKLTIDLNQKTFTVTNGASTNNRNFKINGTSEVTIMNGTMVAAGDYLSGAYGTVRTEGTANVTLTGLKLYNYRGNGLNIKALSGTTVAIDNTEIYSQYGGGIEAAGGTVTLAETVKVEQKGMYTAPYNSMAISVNGGGKVTVNGGTYSTECITATEANNQGTSHGPWVVGVLNSGGTLIINGGTFSNDNFGDNSLATYARGAVLADTKAKVEIYGGTFNALKAIIDIQNNLGDANNNPSVLLAGGTYNADPRNSAQYGSNLITLAEGYAVVENTTNVTSWVVKQVSGTQTREFTRGWNWFSSYVDLSQQGGLEKLQTALGESGLQIKAQNKNQSVVYQHIGNNIYDWIGDLDLTAGKMYMVNTSAAVSASISGSFVDYENEALLLKSGWNWISYPLNQEVDINTALQNLDATQGDNIKGYGTTSIATYYNGKWVGPLATLNPGQGYMYQSAKQTSFVYSTEGNTANASKSNVSAEETYWTPSMSEYANNMVVFATLRSGEMSDNYEVAAFANGECRGSARPIYIEQLDQYMLFMTIYGDEVEEMTFKCYDVNNGTEYDLINRMVYSNDAVVGSLDEPYIFTCSTTGIGEATLSDINIYPNPTTTDREINLQATCDKVEVFNTLGVKVAEYQNVDTIDALETAGTYVIRVTLNGDVKHCRLVVK